ncbi:MAG: XRE family transcriptional regulator [Anaerostipes sp.]|jgi:predicted XRE-type DNA-binding protein|nr:XRE family transcriptional regulator [Anaerostipes sp.]MDD3745523.1 XRE family transcriptional regulator [Anaerostipes sp.]
MVRTYKEFEKWVKVQMIQQELTQRSLANKMNIAYPRISEAIHGKRTGKMHILPLIKTLGGRIDDFRDFLEQEEIHIDE